MTLIVLCLGLFNLFFGEVVPAGGGLGWDGVTYADITRNFPSLVENGGLSNYYAKRFLPSCVVRVMLLASGSSFDNPDIVVAFRIYNICLMCLATLIWKRIADTLCLSNSGRWLGFSSLFLNFNCSKVMFYDPVLTDSTALLAGLLLLLAYLQRSTFLLFLITILASFAWQIVGFCGFLLLLLPRCNGPTTLDASRCSGWTFSTNQLKLYLKVGWVSVSCLALIGIIVSKHLDSLLPMERIIKIVQNHGISWCLLRIGFWGGPFLTGVPSLLGVSIAIVMLCRPPLVLREALDSMKRGGTTGVLAAAGAVGVPWVIVNMISNPSVPNATGVGGILGVMFFPPIGKVLLPLVGLAAFWGPMVLVLATRWGAFCREAQALGLGFVAVIALNLPLGLATEPRYVTLAWPFAVLGGVMVMERSPVSKGFQWAFGVLTVLYAQFWLKINLAPWVGGDFDGLLEFPKQIFFMHYGFWMSDWAYLFYLVAGSCSLIWLWRTNGDGGNVAHKKQPSVCCRIPRL